MKVIVAGSRRLKCIITVHYAIHQSGFQVDEIVSGGAPGVDTLAIRIAKICRIPFKEFPADWNTYGLSAGPMRNRQMAEYADALVAIPDEKSTGTRNMVTQARRLGIPVYTQYYSHRKSSQDGTSVRSNH